MGKSKSKQKAKLSPKSKVSDHAKVKIRALLKQQGIRKPTKKVNATTPTTQLANGKSIKSKKKEQVKENLPSVNGSPVTSTLDSKTSTKIAASYVHLTVKNDSRKTNGSAQVLPLTKKLNIIPNGKSKGKALGFENTLNLIFL